MRGAAGLAQAYLTAHDRIGLVTLSGRVQWLTPGSGTAHLYRIAQTVMDLRKDFTYETGGLSRLPTRVLPRGALVYIFSPLLDPGVVEAISELADRGHPLVVIDVLAHEPAPTSSAGARPDHLDALALRLWRLDLQAVRFVLGELGVPVVSWDGSGAAGSGAGSAATGAAGREGPDQRTERPGPRLPPASASASGTTSALPAAENGGGGLPATRGFWAGDRRGDGP